ncbi:MAG: WG repeat-containing protein [Verrucomicrobia bacterium]|nr:WG repeat-containing protein [Verrucomicrobiota bacterium]
MKLFPYKKGGSYGIIDANGAIVEASGKFMTVGYFQGGYAAITEAGSRKNGIWHNHNVSWVPESVYYLFDVSDGLALACTEDNIGGYVNMTGELVIECKYHRAGAFRSGFAVVSKSTTGKFGLINKNDELVLGFDFDHINDWTANGTTALIGDTWYLIRPSLELLKFGEAHFLHAPSSDGILRFKKRVGRKTVCGFVDLDGAPAVSAETYSDTRAIGGRFCGVKIGREFVFVDRSEYHHAGKRFSDVGFFHFGICPARDLENRRKWGAIDESFDWVIPPIFDGCEHIPPFTSDGAEINGDLILVWRGDFVLNNGPMGYFDYHGNPIWPLSS